MRERDSVGTFEDLHEAATRATGLDDFGGDEYHEGLRILLDDYAQEAGLTGVGNYMQRSFVRGALIARLLSEMGFKQHPEYVDVAIERPVFVTGLPRTGTTALHRLLTADPTHQGVELWLTEFPQPRPPRDTWDDNPVFSGIQSACAEHHVENPEFMGIHYMDAASVEECWRLLRQSGKSIGYESLAYVPNYSAWLAKQDWTDAYARHKANLQLIGLDDQDKRWVLKNPSHLVGLDAIMSVYPDALVVQTHRDPRVAIASACSLSAEATRGWSTVFQGEVIGRTQLDMLARASERFAEERARYDPAQFVDVEYDDFVADPVAIVHGIYSAFDLPWGSDVEERVGAIDEESRSGVRRPAHRYSLEDYGLTEDEVLARF
ncbi:MAG TPA: sulfotransferase [Nocardioidaceae bacterium]|nr:sulfotransferase [Nocardioidaceae bacterium]